MWDPGGGPVSLPLIEAVQRIGVAVVAGYLCPPALMEPNSPIHPEFAGNSAGWVFPNRAPTTKFSSFPWGSTFPFWIPYWGWGVINRLLPRWIAT